MKALQALLIATFLVFQVLCIPASNVETTDSSEEVFENIWLRPFLDPELQWEVKTPEDVIREPSTGHTDLDEAPPALSLFDIGGQPFNVQSGMNQGIFSFIDLFAKHTPWWKGKNVCVEREEITDSDSDEVGSEINFVSTLSINMQTCSDYKNKYECVNKKQHRGRTQTSIVRYQCCLGYQRIKDGDCSKVDLSILTETIKKMNSSEFLSVLKKNYKTIDSENITIFLPSDEAVKEFFDNALQDNLLDLEIDAARRRRQINSLSEMDLIKGHMTAGFQELTTDDVFDSLLTNSSLQIKHLLDENRESKYYVNCIKVTSPNNYALNGIVHRIEKFMLPPVSTIYEIISRKPELSMLKSILDKTGMAKSLNSNEMWTMFTPTNDAFNNLSPHILSSLKKGDSCAVNLVKHHLLGSAFCSGNVEVGDAQEKSALGELLNFSMGESNAESNLVNKVESLFRVNNANAIKKDIIATNGIVHIIDKVMVPDGAMPVVDLMEKRGLKQFVGLIKRVEMVEEINNLSNVTFFIPTDKAFDEYFSTGKNTEDSQKTVLDILAAKLEPHEILPGKSNEQLRSFIKRHITTSAVQSCDFDNNEMVPTLNEETKLRVNLYSTNTLSIVSNTYNRATVNCASLLHFNIPQCNNIIHMIDRPIELVEGTLLDHIRSDPRLTMLSKILNGTETAKVLRDQQDITFLAPTNNALKNLQKGDYELLLSNKSLASTILSNHIVKDVLCRKGVQSMPWPFNPIWRYRVSSYDDLASNGVMHLADALLIPTRLSQYRNSNVDILLGGL